MSQAAMILKNMQEAREQVMSLCNFTEEQLNELQWEAALECLRKVLCSDEYGIYELPKNPDFWLWWRDQWFRRDEQFLNNLNWDFETGHYTCALPGEDARVYVRTPEHFRVTYLHYHRIAQDNPLVNNQVMEVSFHMMIKDIASRKFSKTI